MVYESSMVPDECKRLRPYSVRRLFLAALVTALMSCRHEEPRRAPFVPLSKVASRYGDLVSVGNHPTPDQQGAGERIGLFRAADGTIWGLPIMLGEAGDILVCAAPSLSDAPATDYLPGGTITIVGAVNEPTGLRGGTGRLEIVTRDAKGVLHWQAVRSGETPGPIACWAPETIDERLQPKQRLHYYRLEPNR